MTSGLQPINSGAPIPVQGVTGGPPVLGGQINNDPSSGNIVISPTPGSTLQIRKGSTPTALQVYEFFNSNTSYARVALNTQTNGPFSLAVETQPVGLTPERDIQIVAPRVIVPNFVGSFARVQQTTGQSIANVSGVNPIFNNFVGNDTSIFTTGAGGITVNATGIYLVSFYTQYNVSGGGARRDNNLIIDGAGIPGAQLNCTPISASGGATSSGSWIGVINQGQLVSLAYYQDSGAALTVLVSMIGIMKVGLQ